MLKNLFVLKTTVLLLLSLIVVTTAWADSTQADYLVGPGDVLKITVYDNPDLDATVRVSADGSIQLPLIGSVTLLDLSVEQVQHRVEKLLADGYLRDPQVTVFIEEFRSQKVVVNGHVLKPGVYELRGPTSLLELISMAGGLRENASDRLTINRIGVAGVREQEILHVDLKALLESGASKLNVPIFDKDSVFIARAGMFYVTGEVAKPDAYKFEDGTTVLKAISIAGGFSRIAAKGKVRIVRIIDGRERVMDKVPLQEPVQPDDVIVVPESFF